MTCEQALDTIVLSLYGEAPERDRSGLTVHLSRCPRCSAEAVDLSAAAAAVAHAEGDETVKHGSIPVPVPVPASLRAPSRRLAWFSALAAAVVLVAGGLVVREAALERESTPGPLRGSSAPDIPAPVGDARLASGARDAHDAAAPRPTDASAAAPAGAASVGVASGRRAAAASRTNHAASNDDSLEAEISSLRDAVSSLESSAAEL